MKSHGVWSISEQKNYLIFYTRTDGTDWYEYLKTDLQDPGTIKLMVRDGVVKMLSNDPSMIVPPGEVIEVPATMPVERDWLWNGDHASPPPPAPPPEDPVQKLKSFLNANPDVRSLIG